MEEGEEEEELPELPSPKRYRTHGMRFRSIEIPKAQRTPPDWDKAKDRGEEEENPSDGTREEEEGLHTSEVAAPAAKKKGSYDAESMQRDLQEAWAQFRAQTTEEERVEDERAWARNQALLAEVARTEDERRACPGMAAAGGAAANRRGGGLASTTGVSKPPSRKAPLGGGGEEEEEEEEEEESEIDRIGREVEEELAEDRRREEEKREDSRRREEARRRAEGEGDVDELLEFAGNVGQDVIDRIPQAW